MPGLVTISVKAQDGSSPTVEPETFAYDGEITSIEHEFDVRTWAMTTIKVQIDFDPPVRAREAAADD